MKIICESTEKMVKVVASLVERGLTFEVVEDNQMSDAWIIHPTGGY